MVTTISNSYNSHSRNQFGENHYQTCDGVYIE
jgi:hypothetical protein